MERTRLAVGGIISTNQVALKLREQASTACETLSQLLSRRKELQLEQSVSRAGLLNIRVMGVSRHDQEIEWQVQGFIKMLDVLRLELQELMLKRQRCIIDLRIIEQRRLVDGGGQGRLGVCRCNIFRFRKL
ncbi:hypothetical protein DL98DRAFT_510686 [Cadophora sp. DSE1049]|nr:hypothetical protein DL98DRAFT_510686 [Cadophora sp. DSE1049]